jgi:hypothetical protein
MPMWSRGGMLLQRRGPIPLQTDMKGARVEKGLFEKRAAEKRKSRKADERALKSGKKSREQLRMENGLFSGVKVRLVLEKAKALC